MANFRFTYTRCTKHGTILEHIVDTVAAHTIKSAKHALVKRFGLQSWGPWQQTANGNCVKINSPQDDYRGKIIIEPIGEN